MVSVQEIEEMMSKLNPLAREFTPERHGHRHGYSHIPQPQGHWQGRARGHGHRGRASVVPSREDVVKRTVFVSDIDHLITEEHLASLFLHCGRVVDCRICGDPKSLRRFAFIEFTHQSAARAALSLSGTMLGFYPLKVLPSKTAIAPVNPTFLPQSPHERDMCARTIYCTNIDKKICQTDLRIFFESVCGQVDRLRMLGDYRHSTRIAFVEFVMAESATAALNCSGVVLGSSAIRVSPSKTPVRSTRKLVHSRTVKQSMH